MSPTTLTLSILHALTRPSLACRNQPLSPNFGKCHIASPTCPDWASIIERAKLLQQQYEEPQRWVFVNPRTHKPFRCIFHRWNKIRTELGIGDVRIHDLRHSYASTLVNNGATLYEVQKLLGHSKSRTTERYAHLANHTLIRAASLIDKAFSK